MDNQHKMIKGYRDLSQAEIDLMNEIKSMAEQVGELVKKVTSTAVDVYNNHIEKDFDEAVTLNNAAQPFDWVSSAQQDLQVGFMKLVRAVAKPTTF